MNNNNNNKPPPQPATAAVNSIHWEVEEDHLLSYFLGANEGAVTTDNNIPEPDIAVQQHHHPNNSGNNGTPTSHNTNPTTTIRSASQPSSVNHMTSYAAGVGQHHTTSLENFVHTRAGGSSGGLSTTSSLSGAGGGVGVGLPPTPAVHFYDGHIHHRPMSNNQGQQAVQMAGAMAGGVSMPTHSAEYNSFVHASQQQRLSSNSLQNRTGSAGSMHKVPSRTSTNSMCSSGLSSSSSLTSMAAALALGGPNQVMYMQQKLQSRSDPFSGIGGTNHQLSNSSPITPVNMMGSPSGQEMMMLPPPPRFPNGAGVHHPNGMMMQQMQHQNMGQNMGLNMQQMPQNMQQQHIIHTQQQQLIQQQQMQHQQTMQQPPMQQQQMQQQPMQQQMQQQPMQQQMQHQQMPQVVQSNYASQQINNATLQNNTQNQQPNFLPQMTPLASTVQQSIQHQLDQKHHMGFPNPNSVNSAILAQPQLLQQQSQQPQHQQPQPQQQQSQPQQPQLQQIQIGLQNGTTIPLTAIPTPNGSIYYQIDPTASTTGTSTAASLRYFTKAINEVSKEDQKETVDPKILAEKRMQRLARNRESARQSRRRKKEHLSMLAAQVRRLQRQLEDEIRNKIRSMESGLARQRTNLINKWLGDPKQCRSDILAVVLRKTGPNCPIRRAVIAHQYNFLRQAFLSTHNRYSVWMMMQSSSFFTEASRMRNCSLAAANGGIGAVGGGTSGSTNVDMGSGGSVSSASTAKATTTGSRPNSKQIGEEIYLDERNKQDTGNGKSTITCDANDELKTWPLYCQEVAMTMEQEEKIIHQAHGQARNTPNLQSKLQKMKTATDATQHLQNAMLCHTQLASQRNETLLLDILTPAQTALFLEWMKKNKERCRGLMERQLRVSAADGSPAVAGAANNNAESESTLGGVCKQLEEMRFQEE